MKKTIILLLLTAVMLVSFASCGEETKNDKPAATTPATAQKPQTTEKKDSQPGGDVAMLDSFVNDNEIYFDIRLSSDAVKDFSLTIGSETITESKKIALNKNDSVVMNGEGQEGKKVYVYKVFRKKGEDRISIENFVNIGLRADKLGEILAKTYSQLASAEKAYVAILDAPDGWNKDLSASLNEYLRQILPKE